MLDDFIVRTPVKVKVLSILYSVSELAQFASNQAAIVSRDGRSPPRLSLFTSHFFPLPSLPLTRKIPLLHTIS